MTQSAAKTPTEKKPVAPKTPAKPASDDGYKKAEDDRVELAGYWEPSEGPLHGKLIAGYQFIQKTGKGKGHTRTMYVFDLAESCPARVTVEDPNGKKSVDTGELQPRELCGVFGGPGLRALDNLAGCFVKLRRTGKKEVARGEMWLFDVTYKGVKKPLAIRPPQAQLDREREPGEDDGDDGFDPNSVPF